MYNTPSYKTICKETRHKYNNLWHRRFDEHNSRSGIKQFIPDHKHLHKLKHININKFKQICVLTGHGGTNKYLFDRKLADSPLCTDCLAAYETVEHILLHCTSLSSLRVKYLWKHRHLTGDFPHKLSDLLASKKSWHIWEEFIENCGRFVFSFSDILNL